MSNNYPTLKEFCINSFIKGGNPFEKYEQINNMFHHYRKDISYCYVPLRQDLNFQHMTLYVDKLSKPLKFYLLSMFSCNIWNKDTNSNSALRLLKKFILKNPEEIIYPRIPPNRSLTETRNRTSSLRRRINRRNAVIELPRVPSIEIPPPSNIVPSIQETRESLNELILSPAT